MKKQTKTKKTVFWGSPEYLVKTYDDIDTATKLSPRNKVAVEIKKLVNSVSTPKDKLATYDVMFVSGKGCDGERRENAIAYITFGLNGPGRQSDYFAALKRLTDTGKFFVFECHIDALDDVYSVLASFKD